mgnify:CR=1 FL=1
MINRLMAAFLLIISVNASADDLKQIVIKDSAKFNALSEDSVRNLVVNGNPLALDSYIRGENIVACSVDYFANPHQLSSI